jgi:hypothetical protein
VNLGDPAQRADTLCVNRYHFAQFLNLAAPNRHDAFIVRLCCAFALMLLMLILKHHEHQNHNHAR